jgi:hypothetical protein
MEFSLLADDLPPMTYRLLADSLYLAVPGRDLSNAEFLGTARRWTRMLLTGLPGTGKSTALEQAAARWAGDDDAPVPVLVPLRDLARQHPRRSTDITLPVLVEAAAGAAPEQERAVTRDCGRSRGCAVLPSRRRSRSTRDPARGSGMARWCT